jgi:ssDNA-binding Zn-finger/Zn-ribbon topoisomerase 1
LLQRIYIDRININDIIRIKGGEMKIKCLVCNKEFDKKEFRFHILVSEAREREKKGINRPYRNFSFADDDVDEIHRIAYIETRKEGEKAIEKNHKKEDYEAKCKFCGANLVAYYYNNEIGAPDYAIYCNNCELEFVE